jgi:hypothetical protein
MVGTAAKIHAGAATAVGAAEPEARLPDGESRGGGANNAATSVANNGTNAANAPEASRGYFVDMMFRTAKPADPNMDMTSTRREANLILASRRRRAFTGDRAHLAQLVMNRTGVSQAEADKRVTETTNAAKLAAMQPPQKQGSSRGGAKGHRSHRTVGVRLAAPRRLLRGSGGDVGRQAARRRLVHATVQLIQRGHSMRSVLLWLLGSRSPSSSSLHCSRDRTSGKWPTPG